MEGATIGAITLPVTALEATINLVLTVSWLLTARE
jgi:hypothetical protein